MTLANAQAILTTIIQILFGGLTTIAPLLGNGLSEIMGHMFFTYDATSGALTSDLSVFGCVVLIFWAISIAMGIGRLIVKFITGGGKNRYM